MYHRSESDERLLRAAEDICRDQEMNAVTLAAVAARAGVSVDSAAASFASDLGLREALVHRYYDANGEIFEFILRDIATVEELVLRIQQAAATYHDVFIRDPHMGDVWAEVLSSRGLRPLTLARMKQMSAGLVATTQRLFPRVPVAEIVAQVELMVHMTDVATRWAAARPGDEGRAFLREFNRLVELIAADLIRRNGAGQAP